MLNNRHYSSLGAREVVGTNEEKCLQPPAKGIKEWEGEMDDVYEQEVYANLDKKLDYNYED